MLGGNTLRLCQTQHVLVTLEACFTWIHAGRLSIPTLQRDGACGQAAGR